MSWRLSAVAVDALNRSLRVASIEATLSVNSG
jgi:hypothetical protein